jgi:hypothetical protein
MKAIERKRELQEMRNKGSNEVEILKYRKASIALNRKRVKICEAAAKCLSKSSLAFTKKTKSGFKLMASEESVNRLSREIILASEGFVETERNLINSRRQLKRLKDEFKKMAVDVNKLRSKYEADEEMLELFENVI